MDVQVDLKQQLMKEEVIVARIRVSRRDDQQYFQVVLPRDTVKVTGIESGVVLESILPVNNESFAGNLQLQSEGQANFCYYTDIFLDRPGAQLTTLGFTAGQQWIKRAFEQSGMKEPEPLELRGCHVLYGCFKDIIGQKLQTDLRYQANIYIWIERGLIGLKEPD